MIKAFENFEELNAFLATNNCIVRAIDTGVSRIYVELEEAVTTTQQTIGNVSTIVEEIVAKELAERYEILCYDKNKGCELVEYIRRYTNAETLLETLIVGLDCSEVEAMNLRLCLAGKEFDSSYCK